MSRAKRRAECPPRRAVILGASNVMRGISTVVESARIAWGRPLDLLMAAGHGRSYGYTSYVFGRGLPPIVTCGIWEELQSRPPRPTAALVTDIGNDIFYGASVDEIVGWVEICLERLRAITDVLVLTGLPMDSITTVGAHRFWFMRTILFPQSPLTFEAAQRSIRQLNNNLAEVAEAHGAVLIEPEREWFGIDPIHIKMRFWAVAWKNFFLPWHEDVSKPESEGSMRRWIRLRTIRPLYRTMFGIAQSQIQPATTLPDGSWISFY